MCKRKDPAQGSKTHIFLGVFVLHPQSWWLQTNEYAVDSSDTNLCAWRKLDYNSHHLPVLGMLGGVGWGVCSPTGQRRCRTLCRLAGHDRPCGIWRAPGPLQRFSSPRSFSVVFLEAFFWVEENQPRNVFLFSLLAPFCSSI